MELSDWPPLPAASEYFIKFLPAEFAGNYESTSRRLLDLQCAAITVARAADSLPAAVPFNSMPNRLLVSLYEQACRFLFAENRLIQIECYQQDLLAPLRSIGAKSIALRPAIDISYCEAYTIPEGAPELDLHSLAGTRTHHASCVDLNRVDDLAKALWVHPHRIRNTKFINVCELESNLLLQASWPHIAGIIGIDPKRDRSVMRFMAQRENSGKHYWDSFYDLRDALKLLEMVPVSKATLVAGTSGSTGPLFRKNLDYDLAHYCASQADLFNYAVSTNPPIAFRLDNDCGFEGLQIDRSKIDDLMEERLLSLKFPLSIKHLARIFSVDEYCIEDLIRLGHLELSSERDAETTERMVTNTSWQSFYRNYFILTRWCRPRVQFGARIAPKLAKKFGILPLISVGPSPDKRKFWAYAKTPELVHALRKVTRLYNSTLDY